MDNATQFEVMVHEAIQSGKVAGMAIGIVRRGQLAYARGFGVRDLNMGEPVTEQSLFHVASVSKPFVATAVVQLACPAKLDLDAPVTQALPYFTLNDARLPKVTLRHMLSHTSGMPDIGDDNWNWGSLETDDGALERYVRSLSDKQLNFDPGERYSYSSMAYDVLGDVIAKASGQTFEVYVKQRILNPLGMRESTFLLAEVNPALATNGHVASDDGKARVVEVYPYNRAHSPSSSLHSNVVEMARWAIATMCRGQLEGQRILPSEAVDAMWTQHAQDADGNGRGLGWALSDHWDQRCVWHYGGDPGYAAGLLLYPDADAALIVLVNSDWGLFNFGPMVDTMREAVLGS